MITLTHSPFLKAFGWTLLNSLWQFGILWLLFTLLLNARKKYSPAFKHGFALVLISAGFAWFASGLLFQYFTYSDPSGPVTSLYFLSGLLLYLNIYATVKTFLENNLSYFSIFYLLIVAGFFIRFFRFFFYFHTVQTKGLSKIKPEWRLYVQKMAQHLAISRKVQVWISEYIDTPMVIGFIKPVILIPVACINQLSTEQLEAILLHELAHIKRNDYLVNLYTATIEILFFFNPFARLLIKSIKEEREKSCDDWVLQFRFDSYQYASALLSLEQSRSASYSLAIAAAGENKKFLLQRVQRILGLKKTYPQSRSRLTAYFLTIGLLCFFALLNPGKSTLQNSEKTYSKKLTPGQFTSAYERSSLANIISSGNTNQVKIQNPQPGTDVASDDTIADINNAEEDLLALPVSTAASDDGDDMPTLALLQSNIRENKNFSIKEKDPELPEDAKEKDFPFVPNSSYSYFSTEDSTLLKLKAAIHNNQTTNSSLAQAQKAIQKLDWNKIAKLQKLSKASVLKLQKELQRSLQNLNWSQIYNETIDSINEASTERMRYSLKQEYDKLNNYKALQQQYETIKTELQQQQENYRKGAETELREIQKQVKKIKVIVYI